MIIFDRMVYITNKDNLSYPTTYLVQTLDNMLTEYNIPHAITELLDMEISDFETKHPDQEVIIKILYCEDNEIEFNLIYALWLKVCRGASDEFILKGFCKKGIKAGIVKELEKEGV